MNSKKTLNEAEICQNYIAPAIEKAGWDKRTQIRILRRAKYDPFFDGLTG